MVGCRPNRFNPYGYLDLMILDEYAEYGNSLCEFILSAIVTDYVALFRKMKLRVLNISKLSKSTLYDIKTTRLNHPTWIIRFSSNFKRILRVFACNLRHVTKKISEIEQSVVKANMDGEILRYHAIATALTTVKYDLLTLYVTIRSGGLTALKTSFLYPVLSDTQRWLTYSYYQTKLILSKFPGSNVRRRSIRKPETKICIPSFYMMSNKLKHVIERSEKEL